MTLSQKDMRKLEDLLRTSQSLTFESKGDGIVLVFKLNNGREYYWPLFFKDFVEN